MRRSLLVALLVTAPAVAADPPKPVKVFVLAGQSNMEGKAKVSLLDYQAKQPATKDLYAYLRTADGWAERDDVWIKFLDRHGKLTVGYGSPKSVGPELAFGWVMGDRYDEPVLLVKTAWGGRSLYKDFRPPSAGLPPQAVLDKQLADLQKRDPHAVLADVKNLYGASYRAMVADVTATLADLKTYVPGYAGQGYELAGFAWFQGWNDMIDRAATAEYAANMAHFIRDVRKDLKAEKLPFVIGQMGVDGDHPSASVKAFQAAQAEAADLPEFRGNVALVKTAVFWDTAAEAVFKKGWKDHLDEWNAVGSDYPYHYLGSGKTMLGVGRALAEAVLMLRGEKK